MFCHKRNRVVNIFFIAHCQIKHIYDESIVRAYCLDPVITRTVGSFKINYKYNFFVFHSTYNSYFLLVMFKRYTLHTNHNKKKRLLINQVESSRIQN